MDDARTSGGEDPVAAGATTSTLPARSTEAAPRRVRIEVPVSTMVRLSVWGAVLALGTAAAIRVSGVILQLFVAIFLAIALDTVVRKVQRTGLGRGLSITAVMLALLAVIVGVFSIFVPPLVDQGEQLADEAPSVVRDIERNDTVQRLDDEFDISTKALDTLEERAQDLPGLVTDLATSIVGGVFWVVTLLFLTLFLLVGGGSLMQGTVRLFPRLRDRMAWAVIQGAYRNVGAYVVGALSIAFMAGSSMAIVLAILGVPFALPLGVWMMVLGLIPLIGATIGSIPAILVAFTLGGTFEGIVVVCFIVAYQQVENVVVQPRVQGRMARLPGVVIFFAVLLGSQLLGVVGALFAVPVAAIIAILIREYLEVVGRLDMEVPSLLEDEPKAVAAAAATGDDPDG